MNQKHITNILLIAATVCFDILFWKEKFGINLLIFSFLLTGIILFSEKQKILLPKTIALAAGVFVTGIMVIVFNSGISKATHIISLVLLIGYLHEQRMRSLFYTCGNVIANFLLTPGVIFGGAERKFAKNRTAQVVVSWLKFILIPFLVVVIYYLIYSISSKVFNDLFSSFWSFVRRGFNFIFKNFSIFHVLFVALGFFLISGLVLKNYFSYFLPEDISYPDFIRREKMKQSLKVKRAFELNGLRKEKKTGVILLVLVNVLLLIFNFIDIKILWFGFYAPDQFNMMKFVYEGTGLLLISILMSIGILLYLFRKNQNFYSKNKWLKILSFAWIAQNSILCVSVILRNYYYIFYNGLAYKRIWLFAFLALTIVGLITLIIKIKKLKSFYYLLNLNTWSVYFVLVVLSFFNWDMIIAKTNLSHWNGSGIDIDFYLELSPETYPLIYANLHNIEKQMEDHRQTGVRWVSYWDINSFKNALDICQKEFIKKYEQHTWPSWNLPDEHAYTTLFNAKKDELTFKQFK